MYSGTFNLVLQVRKSQSMEKPNFTVSWISFSLSHQSKDFSKEFLEDSMANYNVSLVSMTECLNNSGSCSSKEVYVCTYIFKRNLKNVCVLLLHSTQYQHQTAVKFNMESIQFDHGDTNKTSEITQNLVDNWISLQRLSTMIAASKECF